MGLLQVHRERIVSEGLCAMAGLLERPEGMKKQVLTNFGPSAPLLDQT